MAVRGFVLIVIFVPQVRRASVISHADARRTGKYVTYASAALHHVYLFYHKIAELGHFTTSYASGAFPPKVYNRRLAMLKVGYYKSFEMNIQRFKPNICLCWKLMMYI